MMYDYPNINAERKAIFSSISKAYFGLFKFPLCSVRKINWFGNVKQINDVTSQRKIGMLFTFRLVPYSVLSYLTE